tara:strand:+ start:2631 stop:2936 length:306 start_codon:yes stop_codon:yes gene_type:complete
MSDKILIQQGGKVVEHKVRSEVERNTEELYTALSNYMGIPVEKQPQNLLVTGIGALEYACIVGKQVGVSKETFMESVTNVWERLNAAGNPPDGTVREQGQV